MPLDMSVRPHLRLIERHMAIIDKIMAEPENEAQNQAEIASIMNELGVLVAADAADAVATTDGPPDPALSTDTATLLVIYTNLLPRSYAWYQSRYDAITAYASAAVYSYRGWF